MRAHAKLLRPRLPPAHDRRREHVQSIVREDGGQAGELQYVPVQLTKATRVGRIAGPGAHPTRVGVEQAPLLPLPNAAPGAVGDEQGQAVVGDEQGQAVVVVTVFLPAQRLEGVEQVAGEEPGAGPELLKTESS